MLCASGRSSTRDRGGCSRLRAREGATRMRPVTPPRKRRSGGDAGRRERERRLHRRVQTLATSLDAALRRAEKSEELAAERRRINVRLATQIAEGSSAEQRTQEGQRASVGDLRGLWDS